MQGRNKRGDRETTQGCAEEIVAVLTVVIRHGKVAKTTEYEGVVREREQLGHTGGMGNKIYM